MKNPKDAFFEYAKKVGLNFQRFSDCVDQNLKQETLAQEVKIGQAQQVASTPTFFVNGRRLVGGAMFDAEIHRVIEEELKKRGADQ